MKQPPGCCLWIVLVKVVEEGGVGQVLQARGIVGHDVGVSWEVGRFVAVAVEALVQAGVVAQIGGGAIRGDGAFRHPADCRMRSRWWRSACPCGGP